MQPQSILVATWSDGMSVVSDVASHTELPKFTVNGLAPDGEGGALAIAIGHSVRRRSPEGSWRTLAIANVNLSCCMAVGGIIYAGTNKAGILCVDGPRQFRELRSFKEVAGRDKWYAGTALIDGEVVGPPLGIRSMTATSDGAVLLVSVHVGGIPRSTDGGATWHPTIDIDSDVHEVRAHPTRPNIVAAASAIGLCLSRDAGATWEVESRGLHAPHCSAVAFAGDDVLISASVDPFAPEGAIYRRGIDESGALKRIEGGLPEWLEGKVDTACIASKDSSVAAVDWKGNLYLSHDYGRTWQHRSNAFPSPNSVLIL